MAIVRIMVVVIPSILHRSPAESLGMIAKVSASSECSVEF